MQHTTQKEAQHTWLPGFLMFLFLYFAIILTVFSVLYRGFQGAFLHTLQTLNSDFVEQVNGTTASADDILQNLSHQIFYTRGIHKLRTYESLSNSDMISGMREINSFAASSTFIDSIYVYNGKQDYVYSTSNFGAVNDHAEAFADKEAVSLLRARDPSLRLLPIGRYSKAASNSANRYLYSFLFFELSPGGMARDNALMINVSGDFLSQMYFGSNPEANALILGPQGDAILMQQQADDDAMHSLSALVAPRIADGSENGYFTYEDEQGARMICFFAKMGNRDWYYVRSVSYAKYLSGLLGMQRNAYSFFILTFLVVLVASLLVTLRIYSPLRRIRHSLSRLSPDSNDTIDALIGKLNALIASSSDASRVNEAFRAMLREEVLRDLLLGHKGDMPGYVATSEYDLSLDPDMPMQLMVISSVRIGQLLSTARTFYAKAEGVVIGGDHSVLFLQPAHDHHMDALSEAFISQNGVKFVVQGNPVPHFGALSGAYAMLLEAFRLRFLYPHQTIISANIAASLEDSSLEMEQCVEKIASALKSGSKSQVHEQYARLMESLSGKSHRSIVFSLTHLARVVLRMVYDLFPETAPSYRTERNAYDKRIATLDDIHQLDAYFDGLFSRIIEQKRKEQASRKEDIVQRIKTLIETEYADAALNSQSIADRFSLSSAYVCRLFRHAEGISLPDHITHIRMEAAKRLLVQTQCMVKDIAQQVGIENSQYFFVLFKQDTGMTPRQYRTTQQNAK